MPTKREKLGKEIDNDIVNVLKNSKNPISTRDLALKINRAWYSVQTHCLKLQMENKINGFKVTNIHVWEQRK